MSYNNWCLTSNKLLHYGVHAHKTRQWKMSEIYLFFKTIEHKICIKPNYCANSNSRIKKGLCAWISATARAASPSSLHCMRQLKKKSRQRRRERIKWNPVSCSRCSDAIKIRAGGIPISHRAPARWRKLCNGPLVKRVSPLLGNNAQRCWWKSLKFQYYTTPNKMSSKVIFQILCHKKCWKITQIFFASRSISQKLFTKKLHTKKLFSKRLRNSPPESLIVV